MRKIRLSRRRVTRREIGIDDCEADNYDTTSRVSGDYKHLSAASFLTRVSSHLFVGRNSCSNTQSRILKQKEGDLSPCLSLFLSLCLFLFFGASPGNLCKFASYISKRKMSLVSLVRYFISSEKSSILCYRVHLILNSLRKWDARSGGV